MTYARVGQKKEPLISERLLPERYALPKKLECVSWVAAVESGFYTIDFFCDGNLIGSFSFQLKK
ncbi:MAG: hypothetical protein IKP11_06420 [Paludibacteraceae bacterium]|nr:hypothetical protein [Paludibacteraceae bacterium]